MKYKIKSCGEKHLKEILEILNEAIVKSTALYDYKPRTMENMKTWFETKKKGNFPVIGIFDPEGVLLGFGSYGTFRNWPAYKYSVEHSLYVRADMRGKGIGKIILNEIIRKAKDQNYHVLIGGIDADNKVSIKLHEKIGFENAGKIKHAGFKFGRWLDLVFYQLILETPAHPRDDE